MQTLAVVGLLLTVLAGCQSTETPGPAIWLADSLSWYLDHGDYEAGLALVGETDISKLPSKARARYLLLKSRGGKRAEATEDAREWSTLLPDDPWASLALAGTQFTIGAGGFSEEDYPEIDNATSKALALLPDEPDAWVIRSNALSRMFRAEEAIALTDSLISARGESARLLVAKGNAVRFADLANRSLIDSSLVYFQMARELDSTNVAAWRVPGDLMTSQNRREEGLELLRRAAALVPRGTSTWLSFAEAVMDERQADKVERHATVRRMISETLKLKPRSPRALYYAATLYTDMGDTLMAESLRDSLIKIEPDGPLAEWTQIVRQRAFMDQHRDSIWAPEPNATKTEFREMLTEFVQRNTFHRRDLAGETYLRLFQTADSLTSDHDLLTAIHGMENFEVLNPHITYAEGPTSLAEREVYLDEAERLARKGLVEIRKNREAMQRFYPDDEVMMADAYTALGYVLLQTGRLDEAEAELARAYSDTDGKYRSTVFRLGQLYERRFMQSEKTTGDVSTASSLDTQSLFDTAFQYYLDGSVLEAYGENPNLPALNKLYAYRFGSDEGLEELKAKVSQANSANRKAQVLAARLSDPRQIPEFSLATMSGDTLSSSQLLGKVVAINFWYTSCGPCIIEMPDYQKLYEQYQGAEDVVILTLNKDASVDRARDWLAANEVTVKTLLDDGYVAASGVYGFPTTWFVGKDGRLAYEAVGWTKRLVEEFSWRLESLR